MMGFRRNLRHALLTAGLTGIAAFAVGFGMAPPAQAFDSDAALEKDGALCTHQVSRAERKYGIPQRLLGAMAATETGRRHKGLGIQIPWPWTINVEGKPFFFHTKREAVAAVEKFRAQGAVSIDVGCMQINLHHHPDAFANLNQALEPSFNVDYAARFLRSNYDDTQSWKTAVGRYHSRTPGHAARYIAQVYGQWYGLTSGKAVASADRTQRPAHKYKSFVRMEDSGKQTNFSNRERYVISAAKSAKPQHDAVSTGARVARVASTTTSAGNMDISIIRPTSSAGKIASTPTVDMSDDSGPLVMNMKNEEKDFTSSKVVSIHSNGKSGSNEDSRFIRFVD